MTTGFGIDPTKDSSGNITSGTSSKDIRNISAGLYSPGVISGGVVTTSASAMTYTVSAGVAAFPIATNETVLGPIPAITIPAATAPTSGTRTDIIYATQGMPTIDGHSNVIVQVGSTLPARSVLLDQRIIGANIKNTNSATKTGSVDYSIPYGASLGILKQHRSGVDVDLGGVVTVTSQSFSVPTDRLVRVSLLTCMTSKGTSGYGTPANYCEAGFYILINGVRQWTWSTPALSHAAANYYFADYYPFPRGTHTVSYQRLRMSGSGTPRQIYSGGKPGTLLTIEDIGPQK